MNTSLCISTEDLGRKEKGLEQDRHRFPDNVRDEAISRSNSLSTDVCKRGNWLKAKQKKRQTKIKPVLVSHKEKLDWKMEIRAGPEDVLARGRRRAASTACCRGVRGLPSPREHRG